MLFWWLLHRLVNPLAWTFAKPNGPSQRYGGTEEPRIDRDRWLWRLNDWAADHYAEAFVRAMVQREADAAEQDAIANWQEASRS